MDVPNGVLAQLGLKIQHALRAFTANDRKAIKMTSENYPVSEFYKTDELITSLGIGEALVTALSEKGTPTPLAATMMRAPESRMDVLTTGEIDEINSKSKLVKKYSEVIDRESAYEMLNKKISNVESAKAEEKQQQAEQKEAAKPSEMGTVAKSAIKVLTSATFIRGAFSILNKIFRK
jgi:hypothetical protein